MSANYEISIKLKGVDEATPTFRDVTSTIIEMRKGNEAARQSFNELYKEIREQQKILRVLKEEAGNANLTFNAFKDALSKFGSIMGSVNHIMVQWNTLQTRINTAQITLNQAQKEYNEAVEKFGPNSEQARKALEKLNEAQRKMNQTQVEAAFQTIMLGVNTISIVPKFMELYKSLSALAAVKAIAAAHARNLAAAQATSAAAGTASVPGHLAAASGISAVGAAAAAASKPLAIFKALLGPPGWALLAGAAIAVTTFFATVNSQSITTEKSLTSFQGTATNAFTSVASGAKTMVDSVSSSFQSMTQTIKIAGQEFASYADYIARIAYDAYQRVQEINAKMRLEYERGIPWHAGRYGAEALLAAEGRWNELARMRMAGGAGGWEGFDVESARRYGTPRPISWFLSLGSVRQYFYGKPEVTDEEMLETVRKLGSLGAIQAQIDFLRGAIPRYEETTTGKSLAEYYRSELERLERLLPKAEKIIRLQQEVAQSRQAIREYYKSLEAWLEANPPPVLSQKLGRPLGAGDLPTTPRGWLEFAAKYSGIQAPVINIENVHIEALGGKEAAREFLDELNKLAYVKGGG